MSEFQIGKHQLDSATMAELEKNLGIKFGEQPSDTAKAQKNPSVSTTKSSLDSLYNKDNVVSFNYEDDNPSRSTIIGAGIGFVAGLLSGIKKKQIYLAVPFSLIGALIGSFFNNKEK